MPNEYLRTPDTHFQGIPCFVEGIPPDKYHDATRLDIYLERYEQRRKRSYVCDELLLSQLADGSRVLSVAEGTGEIMLAFATRYPHLQFYGFDLTANRVAIAVELARHLGIENVTFYIGSVEELPFPDGFFSGVIERGIFHTLPVELKKKNLAEIERTCRGTVVMNWMVRNARWYLFRQWCRTIYFRDRQIWRDSIATYPNIDRRYNTLKKLARLVETETGHRPRILRSFSGDQELERDTPSPFAFAEPLGGLVYATDP
jgi:ubiquinone/menaquinone biosynthesis C-methylase UbiE